MKIKLLFCFVLVQYLCAAQVNYAIEKKSYRNGKPKYRLERKGRDTVEFKSYYKSGQLKDSVWLYLPAGREIPLGTGKTYYENGSIQTITRYKDGNYEYTTWEYGRNGKLKRFEERPTGLTKLYDEDGQQVGQMDYHKQNDVYVSKEYRKGKHIERLGYSYRIFTKKATLKSATEEVEFSAGILISLRRTTDTVALSHCLVEGFSKDSIFISKFHYNEDYGKGSGPPILKYDSTFALGFDQLDTLYYGKHKSRRRSLSAMTSIIVGLELVTLPIIPFAVLPLIGANVVAVIAMYGGFATIGVPLYYYGKYLLKATIQRKYDMKNWSILVNK